MWRALRAALQTSAILPMFARFAEEGFDSDKLLIFPSPAQRGKVPVGRKGAALDSVLPTHLFLEPDQRS